MIKWFCQALKAFILYKEQEFLFMNYKIEVTSQTPQTITVTLGGEVDASVYEQFDSVIFSHYNADKRDIVLDCTDLAFVDSTILGAIVKVYKGLKADGKKLIVKNLSPRIRKLFEICALDKLVELQ